MLVPQYVFHSYSRIRDTDAVFFKAMMEEECIGSIGEFFSYYIPLSLIIRGERFAELFPNADDRLIGLQKKSEAAEALLYYPTVYKELVAFLQCFVSEFDVVKRDDLDGIFVKAVQMCNEKFRESSFGIETLSKKLFVSRTRLHQLFAKHLNLGIKEYINLLRISCSYDYLADTRLSISTIASLCGYNTVRSFNRAFIQKQGMTPTEFRRQCIENGNDNRSRKVLSNFNLFYQTTPHNGE
jgi:AraC-like DNA-binding protein